MLAILSNSTSIKCVIVINWNLLDFSWKVSQLHKSCHLHIFWGVQSKARTKVSQLHKSCHLHIFWGVQSKARTKVSQLHKSCHLHIFWGVQSKARTKVSQLHKSCHLHIFWGVQSMARTIFQESLEPVRRHETFALRMKKEYCNIQFLLYQLVFHRLVSFTSFTRHRIA